MKSIVTSSKIIVSGQYAAIHQAIEAGQVHEGQLIAKAGYRYFKILKNDRPGSEFPLCAVMVINTVKPGEKQISQVYGEPFGMGLLFMHGAAFVNIAKVPSRKCDYENVESILRS
jgi:hypothetical protein